MALAIDLEEDLKVERPFEEIIQQRGLSLHAAEPLSTGERLIEDPAAAAVFEAIKGLGIGKISKLIETDRGVFIARVTQRSSERWPEFDEVREKLKMRLTQEAAGRMAKEAADSWRLTLLSTQRDNWSFKETAAAYGLEGIEVESVGRTEPIAEIPDLTVNRLVFQTPPGAISEVLETALGVVVLCSGTRIPADPSGFDAQAQSMRKDVLARKQMEHVMEWLEQLRQQARLRSFVQLPEEMVPTSE
ncbi:MAG: peptidyl-prolyl cis-trans isomerase [Candidatus Omnitrophica bacterium]|nr:peptidyl-prolyl cis-trans isomerase [Candidatus Omnitrophota bacterium]